MSCETSLRDKTTPTTALPTQVMISIKESFQKDVRVLSDTVTSQQIEHSETKRRATLQSDGNGLVCMVLRGCKRGPRVPDLITLLDERRRLCKFVKAEDVAKLVLKALLFK